MFSKLLRRLVILLIVGIFSFFLWQFIHKKKSEVVVYTGQTLLDDVMETAGGKAKWESKNSLKYKKHVQLFREDGATEIDRWELHEYAFAKAYAERKIAYKTQEDSIILRQKNDLFNAYKNTKSDTTLSAAVIANRMNAGSFVIDLPYSLDSESAELTYTGIDTFSNTLVHKLVVDFKGSEDIWTLYYDTSNLDWLGYWVKTTGHYSMVTNTEMQEVNGFILPKIRKSWRTDSLRNKTWIRAAYEYADFEID